MSSFRAQNVIFDHFEPKKLFLNQIVLLRVRPDLNENILIQGNIFECQNHFSIAPKGLRFPQKMFISFKKVYFSKGSRNQIRL